MDLEYLNHRHAVSLNRAAEAACPASALAHRTLAKHYAALISEGLRTSHTVTG